MTTITILEKWPIQQYSKLSQTFGGMLVVNHTLSSILSFVAFKNKDLGPANGEER